MIEELYVGRKTIYLDTDTNTAIVDCCSIGDVSALHIQLTADQRRRLGTGNQRRTECIQDILPNVPHQVREVFVSGQTPAEWDETFNGGRKHWRHYQDLGYVFDDDLCTPAERDDVDKDKPYPIVPTMNH